MKVTLTNKNIYNTKKLILFLYITFNISYHVFSVDKIDDLSFTNTEITQVLKTISEVFAITIVPDKDVQGTVTRYFNNTNLEQTLLLLLEPIGFRYEVKDGIYFVKKKANYTVDYNEQTKTFNINSNRANVQEIINQISLRSKETIIFQGNFDDLTSINIFNKSLMDSLKLLTDGLDYEIKQDADIFTVKKIRKDSSDMFTMDTADSKKIYLKGEENNVEIKLINKSSLDVIIALFSKYKKRLSLLSKKTLTIPYLDINNVKFDDLLNIIFQHTDQTYSIIDGVYYIYDSVSNRGGNPYSVTGFYKLKFLSNKNFATNVPNQVIPQTAYKLDSENNLITIVGSPSEVNNYINIIKKIDESFSQYKNRVFFLRNIDVKQIKKYLPDKYKKLDISIIEEQNMFTVLLDSEDYKDLDDYMKQIDASLSEYKYKFKYLNPEDVLKSMIPKKISKEDIVLNSNDSSLVFRIPKDLKDELFSYFDSIDIPTPVIRYQLLIVEYLHTNTFILDWGAGIKSGHKDFAIDAGVFNNSNYSISANIDIPTVFGFYFSAFLNNELLENKAKIQMSTEIYGLSGQTANLTNTQTLQYRDYRTTSTNTQEPIYNSTTFGLNLEIKGRATSSNEVFLDVTARISDQIPKQGDGSAPDTSEKTVKNSIRSKTGKPIILGGLTSQKESIINKKLPGFGDIPILGNLFKTHNNSYNDSEFVIYIIPFIQKSDEDLKRERQLYIKDLYEYFVTRK